MNLLQRLSRKLSLSGKLISSYLVFLGIGGLAITVVGSTIVSSTIMAEARRTVKHDLAIARTVYQQELRLTRRTLEVAAATSGLPALIEVGDTAAIAASLLAGRAGDELDFLTLADAEGRVLARTRGSAVRDDDVRASLLVSAALREGRSLAAPEIFTADQLERESPGLARRARLPLARSSHRPPNDGPPAATRSGDVLTEGLIMGGAAPVRDADGRVIGVLYGGSLVNRDFAIVDDVWRELYQEESRRNGETGTVTVFLRDVRVSTNVRTREGSRALGTRVSDEVRHAVLERGERWNGRAFVVDDWFITAYEPIRAVSGDIVGMLYVGVPEASYVATRNGVILSFLGIATVGFLLVIGVTYIGIQRMTRPLGQMVEATRSIAAGDFDQKLQVDPRSESEIARLAGSFNLMLHSLRGMRDDLEEWGRTLEEKVRERTDELVRMQSRVALSERLASLGMLAAGVAHEVNNPLGGILALTALTLEEIPEDDQNRENLEEVVRQTERCRDIVKHLLEFSRQTKVGAQELDLNEVVETTLALLDRQAFFFNIDLVRALAPDLPPITGDRSQLQQVFMNIIMNAVEAMDEQGTLTISTRPLPGGELVELAFADTGCGIPQQDIDRIFDPFFTRGKDGQGTGLGLSIAYGIISQHQGSIAVESEVGRGTTFTIRLRAATAFAAADSAAGAAPAFGTRTTP